MKKIKIYEECVFVQSDGDLSLTTNCKEALKVMHDKDLHITISLKDIDKDKAKKFLDDKKVPYDELVEAPKDMPTYDVVVRKADSSVTFWDNWQYTLDSVHRHIQDKKEEQTRTVQQKMEDDWDEFTKLCNKQNECAKGIDLHITAD